MAFEKIRANPAGLGAVMIVLLLLGLYLANNFAPDFFVDINPILFILILGAGAFALMKAFGELKAKQEFTFKEALIIFGTIGGIIFVLIKYPQIAPNFSVIANEVLIATKSMVGLG